MALGLRSGIVQLVPSDVAWASAFEAERTRIASSLGELPVAIEHIGSTAIPGLLAKPILDLMVGRPPSTNLEPYVAGLTVAGYAYRGAHGQIGRDYFVRDSPEGLRTHHLHLVEQGGELWNSHLTFRDYLRREPFQTVAYATLKLDLAARYAVNRVAYTDGKARFIADALRAATASA